MIRDFPVKCPKCLETRFLTKSGFKKIKTGECKKCNPPPSKKGMKFTKEHRLKISNSLKGKSTYKSALRGNKSPNWKGGVTKKNDLLRKRKKYVLFRKLVFERDNYTCRGCNIRGTYLEVHHIKSFAYYHKLRYKIKNGLTLCRECHKKTDNYMGRAKKYVKKNTV